MEVAAAKPIRKRMPPDPVSWFSAEIKKAIIEKNTYKVFSLL
jgi:hypothetical protein